MEPQQLEIVPTEQPIGISYTTQCEHEMAIAGRQDPSSHLVSWECTKGCGHGESRAKDATMDVKEQEA